MALTAIRPGEHLAEELKELGTQKSIRSLLTLRRFERAQT
jgi:hypothetical protein